MLRLEHKLQIFHRKRKAKEGNKLNLKTGNIMKLRILSFLQY